MLQLAWYTLYVAIAYSASKKRIFIESTAVTNCSFTEAVDELFHHTSGNECMKYGLATWQGYV